MNIVPIIDRTAERLARVRGDQVPVVSVESAPMPAEIVEPAEREPVRASKPDFAALERLPAYWRGRASGRQAAVDFYRGEACQRAVTPGVDVSHDLLRDHQAIAEYERRAIRP
jgi:hypothetical protein